MPSCHVRNQDSVPLALMIQLSFCSIFSQSCPASEAWLIHQAASCHFESAFDLRLACLLCLFHLWRPRKRRPHRHLGLQCGSQQMGYSGQRIVPDSHRGSHPEWTGVLVRATGSATCCSGNSLQRYWAAILVQDSGQHLLARKVRNLEVVMTSGCRVDPRTQLQMPQFALDFLESCREILWGPSCGFWTHWSCLWCWSRSSIV